MRLRLDDFAEDQFPLAVEETIGVVPRGLLRRKRFVGPRMMGMRREMQWRAGQSDRAREVLLDIGGDRHFS
jgi:hypothetical protein